MSALAASGDNSSDGRARNALVSCILGADSELGAFAALSQAKEGARLVLVKECIHYRTPLHHHTRPTFPILARFAVFIARR